MSTSPQPFHVTCWRSLRLPRSSRRQQTRRARCLRTSSKVIAAWPPSVTKTMVAPRPPQCAHTASICIPPQGFPSLLDLQVSKVMDQYLNYASLEEDFFTLLLPQVRPARLQPAAARF